MNAYKSLLVFRRTFNPFPFVKPQFQLPSFILPKTSSLILPSAWALNTHNNILMCLNKKGKLVKKKHAKKRGKSVNLRRS